jgi:hypothetical protein
LELGAMSQNDRPDTRHEDCITIIASSCAEAVRAAQARGLAALGYVIAGPVLRHTFSMAEDGEAMFGGEQMVAATWIRKPGRTPR